MQTSHNDWDLHRSLIWKPPPLYDLRVPGYIEGYVRRFWQASQDHRGTVEAPGRVATLIDRKLWETLTDQHASAPPRVWGAAYRIPSKHVAEATELLNIREINGYSIHYTPFKQDMSATYQTVHAADTPNGAPRQIRCLVYIGLPDNPQFMGPQEPQGLAEHIVRSRGPSGENVDYLYELETALNALSAESGDEHITDLARRCREIQARGK
ncbi:ChaC-like protein [Neohortaea acidophila]|uniref:glutathione-specific gamma-glutamylcyclotransferase n=1 Tax=Neohortaea acidophila TaxID=245834 RepID=A0A6A6PSU6_9PEZI|nr:ChaC-like protein [Neohortaea acidophila]KAF2482563.1 ChaC-like protein [Neohortaea acidophila]